PPVRSAAPCYGAGAPAVQTVRAAGRVAHERLELGLPCQGARHGNRGSREPAHRDRDRAADRTALKAWPHQREPSPDRHSDARLLHEHSSRRGALRLLRRREHEGDPGGPAGGAVVMGGIPVAFEVEITFRGGAYGDDVSELRADADDLRLEAAYPIAGAAVAADLLVDIPNCTDKKLFR